MGGLALTRKIPPAIAASNKKSVRKFLRGSPARRAVNGVTTAIRAATGRIPCQKAVKRIANIPESTEFKRIAAMPLFCCASDSAGISVIANIRVMLPMYNNWGAGSPRIPNCVSR